MIETHQPEPEPEPEPAGAGPWQGEIVSVSGRGSDSSRGLPPAHEITVTGPGGALTFQRHRPSSEGDVAVRVHVLGVPPRLDFDHCPICGTAEHLTEEHVPQEDLGGRVMTLTCAACNNLLGSRVENELLDWFDDAIGSVRFSDGDVPGRRKTPRILLRTTAGGEVGLILDVGTVDPDIDSMLRSGQAQVEYRVPDPKVWRIAAMKHAYLGACLALGKVPDTPMARQVRADLLAARDAPRGAAPASQIAGGLRVARSYEEAHGPPLVLAALVDDDGVTIDGGLSFAGTLFVSWPLEAELYRAAYEQGAVDEN